ncbi:MAG TPA: carboxypeptidase-like regulatory domain-containing protein [Thermoanaerobaculia bacterium]|nr:carboxypeptidase-like regulatory domain-containing protein [Thermoanaerobaculia bacterium]
MAPITLSCPVERKGRRYACEGPAGRFDLQIRSRGFAPHFLWDVALAARQDNPLAPVALQPGASVSGLVVRSDGSPPGGEAAVRLVPQVIRDSGSRERAESKRLSVLERETRPGNRGFFVFADVPPGRYDLEVTEPGWSPGRLEGLEVREGSETRLMTPIEIAMPVVLQVQVSPALAPSGKRWRLRVIGQKVLRTRDGMDRLCDELGYVEFSALPEDTYMLVAEDPANGQPFESREVEVTAPLAFVEWELPLVAVEGRVRLGRKPLPSKVTFGPFKMASRELEADEDGLFAGVLPRAGEWEVEVESREHGVSRFFRDVEVPEPSKAGEVVHLARPRRALRPSRPAAGSGRARRHRGRGPDQPRHDGRPASVRRAFPSPCAISRWARLSI